MFVLLPFPPVNIKILSVSQCIFFSLSKAKYDSGSQVCTYEACKLIPICFSLFHGYRRLFIWIQIQKTWTIGTKRDNELRSNFFLHIERNLPGISDDSIKPKPRTPESSLCRLLIQNRVVNRTQRCSNMSANHDLRIQTENNSDSCLYYLWPLFSN